MSVEQDGALAEFVALRQEMETRSGAQQNLFALQITTSGALFGFALSSPGRTLLLLIIPVSSYLILGRYLIHSTAIAIIGAYVHDELDPRIAGGLGWEKYLRNATLQIRTVRWAHPNLLVFPGVAVLALSCSGQAVFGHGTWLPTAGLVVMWLLGLGVTSYSTYLVWTSVSRLFGPRYQVRQRRQQPPVPAATPSE